MNIKELKLSIKDLNEEIISKIKEKQVFYSISGSHSYGFHSDDSDFDIRGCHVVKTKELFKLKKPKETIEIIHGDIDIVSYELEKFIGLMLKPNGNVLEQLNSPINLVTNKYHKELIKLSKYCISKDLYYHYRGMAHSNHKKFIEGEKLTIKKYLYVLRALMTGIYVLEQGKIQQNILELNKYFKFKIIPRLVEKKTQEKIKTKNIPEADKLIQKLFIHIDESYKKSKLPEHPTHEEKFEKFLMNVRMNEL